MQGVPCIDGNCVDKSYETNGEMMDSVSKLYMVSKIRDAKDFNFKIFAGFNSHCSKKATGYINCCAVSLKGWGNHLGAHCNSDEKQLIENRKKNLCVYVGKENRGIMKTVVKHHYCCFGNSLQKVVQVEGRKQLYAKGLISSTEKNFGSGGNPNCRGLTLAELQNLDFDKMDLTEFIEDFKLKFAGKYKAPNVGDITIRIKGTATSNIRKGDNNPHNKGNNKSGWSTKIGDD
ncbi:conjugal transfer protein TraN [Candidatus Tisiphia endosymbiont of Ceraclea dissimilis]|uniref:conjugal transfer protein TraN n=1 Tax=Candidatus Tisiphia endosymbiont of Ceraclea dissimilis TaxID=3077928 RepID=UPI003CCB00B9